MRCCLFNIYMLILSSSALSSNHSAAVHFRKIAIREFVSSFCIFIFIRVYTQVPFSIFLNTVLFDILILFLGRRPMFAPLIFLVKYITSFFYQLFRMLKRPLIQYYI